MNREESRKEEVGDIGLGETLSVLLGSEQPIDDLGKDNPFISAFERELGDVMEPGAFEIVRMSNRPYSRNVAPPLQVASARKADALRFPGVAVVAGAMELSRTFRLQEGEIRRKNRTVHLDVLVHNGTLSQVTRNNGIRILNSGIYVVGDRNRIAIKGPMLKPYRMSIHRILEGEDGVSLVSFTAVDPNIRIWFSDTLVPTKPVLGSRGWRTESNVRSLLRAKLDAILKACPYDVPDIDELGPDLTSIPVSGVSHSMFVLSGRVVGAVSILPVTQNTLPDWEIFAKEVASHVRR